MSDDEGFRWLHDPDVDDWQRARALWLLSTAECLEDPRPNQIVPERDPSWNVALYQAGRGWGKTRVGAADVSEYARTHPGCRIAIVAETYADGRDVCIEGDSGLLNIVPPAFVDEWNRSLGELRFTNGSRADLYSSEKPDQLRGPQHHRAWVDELAKFRRIRDTWDNLIFGLRLGDHPRVVVTTTPKPLGLLRELHARSDVVIIRGATFDNSRNLAASALADWRERYEGTRIGRQELYAELLDDYEGALWHRQQIDEDRVLGMDVPDLARICVGIDPSAFSPELGEPDEIAGVGGETGIVAVGIDRGKPPHVYVLEDRSGSYTGEQWGHIVVDMYRRYAERCPTSLVPEMNLAGPMVLATIRLIDPTVRFFYTGKRPGVHAAKAKRARAEEPATLYEQHRAHHVGSFPELEDCMCTWDPHENWSPDRMDALVWAIHALEPWRGRKVRGISPVDIERAGLPVGFGHAPGDFPGLL